MKIGKDPKTNEPIITCDGEEDDPNTVFNVKPKPDVSPECIQLESNEEPGNFVSVKPEEGVTVGDGDDTCNLNGYKPNLNPLLEPKGKCFSAQKFIFSDRSARMI